MVGVGNESGDYWVEIVGTGLEQFLVILFAALVQLFEHQV